MWVRLTRGMIEFIDSVVPEPCREELSFEREFSGERTVLIHAAFCAWELARDRMAGAVFTEAGRRRKTVNYTQAKALQRVSAACNATLKHAALRHVAVIGHHAVTFPVWKLTDKDEHGRYWWPSPIRDAEFIVLRPIWHDEGGTRLTTWGRSGIRHDTRLDDEAVHWRVLELPHHGEQGLPPSGER